YFPMYSKWIHNFLLFMSCLFLLACQTFVRSHDRSVKAEATKVKQYASTILANLSEDKLFNRSTCGVLAVTADQNIVTVVSKNVYLAGLRPGDVIHSIDDQQVTTHDEMREALAKKGVSEKIKLGINRNGKKKQ